MKTVHSFTGIATSSTTLADVLIYPDGKVEVVDVGEIADALTDGTLKTDEMIPALRSLDKLLALIYSGRFGKIQDFINNIEEGSNSSK